MADKKYQTILLDQDGVLAKFTEHATKVINRLTGKNVSMKEVVENGEWGFNDLWDLPPGKWWELLLSEDAFWFDIEPFGWAKELFDRLNRFADEVVICTSPPEDKTGDAAKQKFDWLKEKLGIPFDNVFVGKKKYVMSRPGNLLVDDYAKNVRDFMTIPKVPGEAIVVPGDWNTLPEELTFEKVWKEIEKHVNR